MKLAVTVAILAFVCSFANAGILKGPLHASCKVAWVWPNSDCGKIKYAIVDQINKWTTEDNCKNGGEKCLYTLKAQTATVINATHMTPVKHYVDDLTFTFTQNNKDCNCAVRSPLARSLADKTFMF